MNREKVDQICVEHLNAPDFGRPCLTRKRRVIGFLLVVNGLIIIYAIAERFLG